MTLTPQQREEVLEAMARTILIADGAAIFRDDDAWADELWRHRKLCAEIPTYPDAPCALSTAFRQAAAALDAALPVIWRGCLEEAARWHESEATRLRCENARIARAGGWTDHVRYAEAHQHGKSAAAIRALAEETR